MKQHVKSPAEYLSEAVSDLGIICDELLMDWNDSRLKDDNTSGTLKTLTEYRHFLKLRFDVLARMGDLIDEARFQQALLLALKGVDEKLHGKVVEILYSLEDEWGDEEDDEMGEG
jgi:hypothetical protein